MRSECVKLVLVSIHIVSISIVILFAQGTCALVFSFFAFHDLALDLLAYHDLVFDIHR